MISRPFGFATSTNVNPLLFGCCLLLGQPRGICSSPVQQRMCFGESADDNMALLDSVGKLWNGESVPRDVSRKVLGWNPRMDVVGAGVYGGIVKRDPETGKIILGHEWPENNADWSEGPHNRIAPHQGLKSPFLDFTKYTESNRGYTQISNFVTRGDVSGVKRLFNKLDKEQHGKLANLVMAGGARPLHMCGMTYGGDPQEIVRILIEKGADPNSMDNYGMTPLDRMLSNRVAADTLRSLGGNKRGPVKAEVVPDWGSDEFAYAGGIGETEEELN
jgi:hypothetical protein